MFKTRRKPFSDPFPHNHPLWFIDLSYHINIQVLVFLLTVIYLRLFLLPDIPVWIGHQTFRIKALIVE